MKRIEITFLLLLAGWVSVAHAAAPTAWEDLNGRIVLDLPSGWRFLPSKQVENRSLEFQGSGADLFSLRFSPFRREPATTFQKAAKELGKVVRKLVPVKDPTCMEVNGLPACWGFFQGFVRDEQENVLPRSVVLGVVVLDELEGNLVFQSTGAQAPEGAWETRLKKIFLSIRLPGTAAIGASKIEKLDVSRLERAVPPIPFPTPQFAGKLLPGWEPTSYFPLKLDLPRINVYKDEIHTTFANESTLQQLEIVVEQDKVLKSCREGAKNNAVPAGSWASIRYSNAALQGATPPFEVAGEKIEGEIYKAKTAMGPVYLLFGAYAFQKGCVRIRAFAPEREQFEEMLQMLRSFRVSTREERAVAEKALAVREARLTEKRHGNEPWKTAMEQVALFVDPQDIRRAATKGGNVRWRVALGASLVEEMRFVGADKLLAGVRDYSPDWPNRDLLLIDSRSGMVLWRYNRRSDADSTFDLLLSRTDVLLFRVDHGARNDKVSSSLLALATDTGREKWSRKFQQKGHIVFHTGPDADFVVVEQAGDDEILLSAVNLADGERRWKKAFALTRTAKPKKDEESKSPPSLPAPVIVGADVLHGYDGLEKLAGADGRSVWARRDLRLDENSPSLRLDGADLFVVTGGKLSAFDPTSGASRWTVELPSLSMPASWEAMDPVTGASRKSTELAGLGAYTNIDATDKRVYVHAIVAPPQEAVLQLLGDLAQPRGEVEKRIISHVADGGAVRYPLVAVQREGGKLLWTDKRKEACLGLQEAQGRMYCGTKSSLVAVDAGSGKELFTAVVSEKAGPAPVLIRTYPDKVVYIGEPDIAAFDSKVGELRYRHSFAPLDSQSTLGWLNGETEWLRYAGEKVAWVYGGKTSPIRRSWDAQFSRGQIAQYQSMASDHRRQAAEYSRQGRREAARGESLAAVARTDAAIASAQMQHAAERTQAMLGLMASAIDTMVAMQQASILERAGINPAELGPRARKVRLLRKILLSSYASGEIDYMARPHWKEIGPVEGLEGGERPVGLDRAFACLSVVHLPSGRRRDTCLSPSHRKYGLTNLVDYENRMLYHQGVGLEPSLYKYGPARVMEHERKESPMESFLIAAPVDVPQ